MNGYIDAVVTFFDEHYRMRCRNETGDDYAADGSYRFAPAKALETYGDAINPLPTVAALRALLPALLKYAGENETDASPSQRGRWKEMLGRLPPLPTRVVEGHTVFAPAASFNPVAINSEDPQLYAVFPYALAVPASPEYQLARDTWQYDDLKIRMRVCWGQSQIWAAKLGLTEAARFLIIEKLQDANLRRFPAFWGPGPDWVPDIDHGGAGMIGLQEMLMHTDDEKIRLLPAWPRDWDVDFKLHAPGDVVVEGTVRNARLEFLKVTPCSAREAIVICHGWAS